MITRVTEREQYAFGKLVHALRDKLPFPITPCSEVALFWDDSMNADNGVLGSYSLWHQDRILLTAEAQNVPDMVVPVLCHELRHHYQYHNNPALYILCAVPVVREYTIEKSADAVELAAESIMENGL